MVNIIGNILSKPIHFNFAVLHATAPNGWGRRGGKRKEEGEESRSPEVLYDWQDGQKQGKHIGLYKLINMDQRLLSIALSLLSADLSMFEEQKFPAGLCKDVSVSAIIPLHDWSLRINNSPWCQILFSSQIISLVFCGINWTWLVIYCFSCVRYIFTPFLLDSLFDFEMISKKMIPFPSR